MAAVPRPPAHRQPPGRRRRSKQAGATDRRPRPGVAAVKAMEDGSQGSWRCSVHNTPPSVGGSAHQYQMVKQSPSGVPGAQGLPHGQRAPLSADRQAPGVFRRWPMPSPRPGGVRRYHSALALHAPLGVHPTPVASTAPRLSGSPSHLLHVSSPCLPVSLLPSSRPFTTPTGLPCPGRLARARRG